MLDDQSTGTKRVLVTGGGSGIGLAVVKMAREAGYVVDFTLNRSVPALEEGDGRGCALKCDLASAEATARLLDEVASKAPYYGLVHCAGVSYDSLAVHASEEHARDLFEVNFWSLVRIAKAVLPSMVRARSGRIIAIGSVAAEQGGRGNSIYAASKGALAAYTKSLSAEVASRRVTVNCVLPGYIDTKMMAGYDDKVEALKARIPAGRPGSAADVAQVVKFLLEPGAGYVTGASFCVDGGLSSSLVG